MEIKEYKIPKTTLAGGAGATTLASKAIAFGQSIVAKLKVRAKDAVAGHNAYYEVFAVVKNAPAPVIGTGLVPFDGGSGYSNNTGVATTGGSGSGLTVDTTTSGGAITSFDVNAGGINYKPGDIITISGGNANAKFRITESDLDSCKLVGTPIVDAFEDDSSWVLTVAANNTTKKLEVKATPDGTNATEFEGYLYTETYAEDPV